MGGVYGGMHLDCSNHLLFSRETPMFGICNLKSGLRSSPVFPPTQTKSKEKQSPGLIKEISEEATLSTEGKPATSSPCLSALQTSWGSFLSLKSSSTILVQNLATKD